MACSTYGNLCQAEAYPSSVGSRTTARSRKYCCGRLFVQVPGMMFCSQVGFSSRDRISFFLVLNTSVRRSYFYLLPFLSYEWFCSKRSRLSQCVKTCIPARAQRAYLPPVMASDGAKVDDRLHQRGASACGTLLPHRREIAAGRYDTDSWQPQIRITWSNDPGRFV